MARRQTQTLVLRNPDCAGLAAGGLFHRPRDCSHQVEQRIVRAAFAEAKNPTQKQSPSGLIPAGIFAPLRLFLFREVLLFPVDRDAAHQLKRQGLIQRELYRALAQFKAAEFVGKRGDSVRPGVKADVVLVRGEMHHVALEVKGWDAVGDFLSSVRGDFENRVAHLVEFCLHLRRELEDVVGDGGGHAIVPPI